MSIQLEPLPLPSTANATQFADFGRVVNGVNPGELSSEQFKEIEQLLYKVKSLSTALSRLNWWYWIQVAFNLTIQERHCIPWAAVRTHQGEIRFDLCPNRSCSIIYCLIAEIWSWIRQLWSWKQQDRKYEEIYSSSRPQNDSSRPTGSAYRQWNCV